MGFEFIMKNPSQISWILSCVFHYLHVVINFHVTFMVNMSTSTSNVDMVVQVRITISFRLQDWYWVPEDLQWHCHCC